MPRPPASPAPHESSPRTLARREALALLASIVLIAAGGLICELLIATVAAYLLGNSVTQFSLTIGLFLGAMGLGSHLSQGLRQHLLDIFIRTEIALGLLGGASVALLFWSYTLQPLYWGVFLVVVISIGALTGLELPVLTRLLRRYGTLRRIIAQALAFDYIGALLGALLFPLLLLPWLGLMRTACLVGLLNLAVAAWNIRVFRHQIDAPRPLWYACGIGVTLLSVGFVYSLQVISLLEGQLYEDTVLHAAQTPYQRVVLTRWKDDLRLFLDGRLQFSSLDEYRYHEALVHPAMALPPVTAQVLLLGAGDGLAAREILKYPQVERLTLVDIDAQITRLAQTFPPLMQLNQQALLQPRVHLVHADAQTFLAQEAQLYDVIIADFPDPSVEVLAKLYTVEFYRLVKRRLAPSGVFVTQATSPFFTRQAFWCIVQTLTTAGLVVAPYHAYVPSFGDWGFVLAAPRPLPSLRLTVSVPTRFLTSETLPTLFVFGQDVQAVPVEPSTLDQPFVLRYHNQSAWQ